MKTSYQQKNKGQTLIATTLGVLSLISSVGGGFWFFAGSQEKQDARIRQNEGAIEELRKTVEKDVQEVNKKLDAVMDHLGVEYKPVILEK